MPTVVIATKAFADLARQVADTYGMPQARIVVVDHPLGGIDADAVAARVDQAVEPVIGLITRDA